MAPTLRFSSLVLLAASWMLAAGCGDDETLLLATGGSSGQAGTGAHAGSTGAHAGASAGAGKPGTSEAGSSGTDTGGAAGEGGEPISSGGGGVSGGAAGISGGGASGGGTGGATAGSGGAAAGSGGTAGGGATAGTGGTAGSGGTAGNGGTAGTGGNAGTGGAPNSAVKSCAYSCDTDDDCTFADHSDQTYFCNPTSKHCENLSACTTASDCVGFANQFSWFSPCVADNDCAPGTEACVVVGRGGLCAPLPDSQTGCTDGAPTQLARFGATGNAQVCANAGLCINKACQSRCDDPISGGCLGTASCNGATGLCDCSSSGQCTAPHSGKPVCGADSHCGCATSDQCAAITTAGFDKCYSGSCGCSSANACPTDLGFKNAPPVCE